MTEQKCPRVPASEIRKIELIDSTLEDACQVAAQWGWEQAMAQRPAADTSQAAADAELEACCDWLDSMHHSKTWSSRMRAARRPPAPSVREQAVKALREQIDHPPFCHSHNVRNAMELALRALEGGDD